MNNMHETLISKPFIAGRSYDDVKSNEYTIYEPASGALLATGAAASNEAIDEAVEAANHAWTKWKRTSGQDRSQLLHAIADEITRRSDEISDLECRNVGKAIRSVQAEVAYAASTFRYFASVVGSISGRSSRLSASIDFSSHKEPVGVVAQIIPWNYPLLMAAWKIAPALAAGCTTVLKPDLATPLSALLLAQIASDVGVPPGVINVVPADGPTVGAYLVSHPGVSKVAFTGSTQTGVEIMRLAAHNISRVTLELGGKGANIVLPDADVRSAAAGAVWSAFSSAGQSCEARTRNLVHRSVAEEFRSAFAEFSRKMKVGDPRRDDTLVGSLISQGHRDRVHAFVERADANGDDVIFGGRIEEGAGAFYPLTLIEPTSSSAEIVNEEIFGPVATIECFDDEAEAIELANSSRYGLLSTVWTQNSATSTRVAHALRVGTVGINHPLTTFPGVPFGGVKHSGFGREFSVESLDDYLETKSITRWISSRELNLISSEK